MLLSRNRTQFANINAEFPYCCYIVLVRSGFIVVQPQEQGYVAVGSFSSNFKRGGKFGERYFIYWKCIYLRGFAL